MAFVFDVNNIGGANGGAEVIFDLKELLKSAGWSIRNSSDGTTFNAAGDQISQNGAGAFGMNNSNAWFVVRAPATLIPRREFMFQHGLTNQSWKCFVSAEDGFVGGAPNATTPPTSTDEQQVVGSGGAFDLTWFPGATTYKYHLGADNTLPFGWYGFAAANGTGVPSPAMVLDPLASGSFPSADEDPAVYHFHKDTVNGAFHEGAVMISLTVGPRGWFKKDLGGELFVRMPAHRYSTTLQSVPGNIGNNPYDSDDNHFPIPLARNASDFVSEIGWKGFGTVMRWSGVSRGLMDTLSVSAVRNKVYVGGSADANVLLPWPNVVPAI